MLREQLKELDLLKQKVAALRRAELKARKERHDKAFKYNVERYGKARAKFIAVFARDNRRYYQGLSKDNY